MRHTFDDEAGAKDATQDDRREQRQTISQLTYGLVYTCLEKLTNKPTG